MLAVLPMDCDDIADGQAASCRAASSMVREADAHRPHEPRRARADHRTFGVILRGASVPATRAEPTGLAMPAFADRLDDAEVAQLTTYIRNAWGNRAGDVASGDVRHLREKLSALSN
jgi:hypothetical protein